MRSNRQENDRGRTKHNVYVVSYVSDGEQTPYVFYRTGDPNEVEWARLCCDVLVDEGILTALYERNATAAKEIASLIRDGLYATAVQRHNDRTDNYFETGSALLHEARPVDSLKAVLDLFLAHNP